MFFCFWSLNKKTQISKFDFVIKFERTEQNRKEKKVFKGLTWMAYAVGAKL